MLITLGKISDGDYGEQSLTSRFLIGLVLNEYSIVNMPDGKAFREFGERCLGLHLPLKRCIEKDIECATATVEFHVDRVVPAITTQFDILLTFEKEWIWGIEAKYFDVLEEAQIQEEIEAISKLAESLEYEKAGVLFIAPEEQLGWSVHQCDDVCKCLEKFIRTASACVRVASWEIIFEILIGYSPEKLGDDLSRYCKFRNNNRKSNYPYELDTKAQTSGYKQWERYITGEDVPTSAIRRKPPPKSWTKGATADIREVCGKYTGLCEQIIECAGRYFFEAVPKKSKYVDLKAAGKTTKAQIHALACRDDGLGLAIGNVGRELPRCQILHKMDIRGLAGYKKSGACKRWLEGKRRGGNVRPAKAFHIPSEMENNPEHPGWKKVEALLDYALTRDC